MNKKSIIALTSAAVLTLGMTIGSYAWFTSSATSQGNTFQSGTLGITSSKSGEVLGQYTVALDNMQCGSSESFTYTVNNLRNGAPSTLDLHFVNSISDNLSVDHSLLNVAKFDLSVSLNGASVVDQVSLSGSDLSYAQLIELLQEEIKLTGGAQSSIVYTINVKLPNELTTNGTDNEYQGKTGSFTMTANAHQTNQP